AGRVWVLNEALATLTPVDERSGRVGAPQPLPGNPVELTFGYGAVWLVDTSANSVQKVPVGGSGGIDTIPVGKDPIDVTAGDGSVWVTNSGDRSVTRIEPLGARVVQTIDAGGIPTRVTVAKGT